MTANVPLLTHAMIHSPKIRFCITIWTGKQQWRCPSEPLSANKIQSEWRNFFNFAYLPLGAPLRLALCSPPLFLLTFRQAFSMADNRSVKRKRESDWQIRRFLSITLCLFHLDCTALIFFPFPSSPQSTPLFLAASTSSLSDLPVLDNIRRISLP